MKKYLIIAAVLVLIFFIIGLVKCSSIGVSDQVQTGETTGGAVDMSPIPADSEFLKE